MTNAVKIKYFLYARRSVEKRDKEEKVVSIESQLSEMKALAQSQNLDIVKIFHETKSAKRPYSRPEFAEMIKQIQEGKANGILVWKMDRLARNPIDEGTIKYLLQEGVLKNIKASDRDWYPDDNVLLASVEFGVATQYSRDLAKHIKRGLRAKVEMGHRPCIAPIGYRNSKYREKGKETILVDDNTFSLVRKVFDLALTGNYGVTELTQIARDKLGMRTRGTSKFPSRPISKSNIDNLLRNIFYCGEFEYPSGSDIWHIGKHTPVITRREFDTLQRILKSKGFGHIRGHSFPYTGLMKCGGCGASITAEEKIKLCKDGVTRRHVYYRCTRKLNPQCKESPITEKDLEVQIYDIINQVCIPKKVHEWVISQLKALGQIEDKDMAHIIEAQKRVITACQTKLDSMLDLRVSGEITSDEYARRKRMFEDEMKTARNEIADLESKEKSIVAEAQQKLTFAETLAETFKKGDNDEKRILLKDIGSDYVLKDKKLSVAIRKPLLLLKELESSIPQKEVG